MSELKQLPISPKDAQEIISKAAALLPAKMDTKQARALVTAICLQESGLNARRQHGNGPARGLAQFERGGGVRGVLRHPASESYAKGVLRARNVDQQEDAAWAALEFDDVLAMAFARLLLWTDPRSMPPAAFEGEAAAWDYYERNWRPGKPHRERWSDNWQKALEAVNG